MAVSHIISTDNVDVGIRLEATTGTYDTGGAFDVVETTGVEVEYPTGNETDNTTGDQGGPKDDRTTGRGGNANFPMHARFNANRTLVASANRRPFQTAVEVLGTSDIEMNPSGTHNDGSTGIQIVAPTGDLNSLITYGGATANGAGGLFMLVRAFTNGANNQPLLIKDVWNNGSNDVIDAYPGWGAALADAGGGSTTPDTNAVVGAPKIAETGASARLMVGTASRNYQTGANATDSYSVLIDFFESSDRARFEGLRGWVGNDVTYAGSGKGAVTCTVTGNGRGWTPLQRLPPNNQAIGSHLSFSGLSNRRMYINGDDLQHFVITTYPNADAPTARCILLADANMTGWTLTSAGNVAVQDDISGTDEYVPRRSGQVPSGSFDWLNTPALVAELITQLGQKGTAQRGAVHAALRNEDDEWLIVGQPNVNFVQTGPGLGARGNASSGTQNFNAMALSRQHKAFVVQEIDAS